MIEKILPAALLAAALACGRAEEVPPLRRGDLLFRADEPDAVTEAIQGVSDGYGGIRFSHVGIVDIRDGDTTVIEALFSGVKRTPLKEFVSRAALNSGRPSVLAERLRPPYDALAGEAADRAAAFIGMPYDEAFLPDNEAYYCTELVQVSYLGGDGLPLFASKPMTFKDNRTGEIPQAWIDFFASRGLDIPEGVPGTNPGDMAADGLLEVVYSYY